MVILAFGGWVAWRTYQAYSHLQAASDQVSVLQTEIKDITSVDLEATDPTVNVLQGESAKARSAVSDPIFRAATKLPWIGANLHAISEVTSTVNSLATDVVPSLVQIAQTLQPSALVPKNGVIDLAPIEADSPLLQKAAAVNSSRARLSAIDLSAVVRQVNSAVLELWGKLDDASSITSTGARVARLLPPMLGADQARTYHRLSEPGRGAHHQRDLRLVRDGPRRSGKDQDHRSGPSESLDRHLRSADRAVRCETTHLYGNLTGVHPQDVNFTPDFPTAARLFAKMYTTRQETAIDGVIATDPVALPMPSMAPVRSASVTE